MANKRKILIIKTGFSEFLDRGISTTVSLGDVLICTSLLRLYERDHVTWVGSKPASGLLKDNPRIDKLLIFGTQTFKDLYRKKFDVLINLEKDIGISAHLAQVDAVKRCGFYFNDCKYDIDTYKRSTQYLLTGQENQKDINKNSFEILFETVGSKWDGQGAELYRKTRKKEIYDIGFNYSVGTKWPTKGWPLDYWKKLEELLQGQYKISWQKGFDNIDQYIDWNDSCRLIVTSDSLGQVLAQALGKKVITLYGSTNFRRMERLPNVKLICSPSKCPHRPCYLPICKHDKFCMEEIDPAVVAEECRKILKS